MMEKFVESLSMIHFHANKNQFSTRWQKYIEGAILINEDIMNLNA